MSEPKYFYVVLKEVRRSVFDPVVVCRTPDAAARWIVRRAECDVTYSWLEVLADPYEFELGGDRNDQGR